MVGLNLHKDPLSLNRRQFFHLFAVSIDIAKVYRQENLNTQDKNCKRIFWKERNPKYVKRMRMASLTYGAASSALLFTTMILVEEFVDKKVQLRIFSEL